MYNLLIVSTDKDFLALAMKFIPHTDVTMNASPASSIQDAVDVLNRENIDVVAFDHSTDNDFIQMLNTMSRVGKNLPIVLMSKERGTDLLVDAINRNINAFIQRGGRSPMEFFKELSEKVIINAERRRNEVERKVNESRMEALINMAKMSDKEFSEVVNYALEKAVELTQSMAGYVSHYDKERQVLKMLAWSKGGMKRCEMSNFPVEFDLRTAGVWGEPIRTGKTIVLNNYDNDRRMLKKGLPTGHMPLTRLIMVPIFVNGELVGTSGVANKSEDYNWFDEVQLTLLMEEMFSIYNKLEKVKEYSGSTQIIRELTEYGSMGLMFITSDMNLVFINKVATEVLDCNKPASVPIPLESLSSPLTESLMLTINDVRRDGNIHRFRSNSSVGGKERIYDVSVSSTDGMEGIHPGFTVMMSDITEIQKRDDVISRAIDHIRILEGPVLSSFMESRPIVRTLGGVADENQKRALDRLDEAIVFMDDYRSVGIKNSIWMNLEETTMRARNEMIPDSIHVTIQAQGIKILADPAFPTALKQLISNSLVHGEYVTEIELKCRITQGNLKIIYRDNGAGIPEDLKYTLFDQVYKGKFGMFLIYNILNASGFTIRTVEADRGAAFEITVPPSNYSLG